MPNLFQSIIEFSRCNLVEESNVGIRSEIDLKFVSHLGFDVRNLFIYLGFYIAFNTVQIISRRVVGTVNCR